MARKVFFSFHYADDIGRAMVVRNSGAFRTVEEAGFLDKADFETVQRQGDQAIRNWINRQLNGTTVTAVLIGEHTLQRPWVQYEISESYKRGNAILGVQIHNVQDYRTRQTSSSGYLGTLVYQGISFSRIATSIYDYVIDDGYNKFGRWVESAYAAKPSLW